MSEEIKTEVKRLFEREREVDLSVFGYDKPAIVKRLTAGEKKRLDNSISKANGIRVKGNEVVGDLSPGEVSLLYAMAYYKAGPFPKTAEAFEELDWEVISVLEDAGDELNAPFATRKSSEPSKEQGTPSSMEAKPTTP